MPVGPAHPLPGLPPALADHPKFRILQQLGQGGMGTVYLAEHRLMQRQVAIKVINRALLDHPDALKRFFAEVRAAARLSHPNIVTAHDAEPAGDLHLLVMEYVEGLNLAEYLARKGPLPIELACHFVRQVALGLQHAHEQGMVHRDIKPHNLMLTRKGVVKILDFGLARLASEQQVGRGITKSNAFVGTPEYVAPEQATDARTADIRADLYSLGCTLYALLAGRPPFDGGTAVQLILAHVGTPSTPIESHRPDVPAGLSAILNTLLAKKPADRFATPAEVARALAPYCRKPTDASRDRQSESRTSPPAAAVSSSPRASFLDLELDPAPPVGREVGRSRTEHLEPTEGESSRGPRGLTLAISLLAPIVVGGMLFLLVSLLSLLFHDRQAEVPSRSKSISDKENTHPEDSSASRREPAIATTLAKEPPPKLPPEEPKSLTFDLGNGVKLEMVRIPPGKFLMGSPLHEADRQENERQHEVTISKPFYLAKYEVTQEQYLAVMGNNPSHDPVFATGGNDTPRFPVERVSWDDAMEFCRKLNQRDPDNGMQFDLPTEAQWEYACRAGATTSFHFGNECNGRQANCDGNSPSGTTLVGPCLDRTCRVGCYPPNAWGLHDMHGNVCEWCKDWYGDYPKESATDPASPKTGTSRVIRGGAHSLPAWHLRSACRDGVVPTSRFWGLGFRPARTNR